MSDMRNDRRWRRMRVSVELLQELLRGRAEPSRFTTAPPDLQIIGLAGDPGDPREYHFIVWSATFSPVAEGQAIPFEDFEYM